MRVFGTTLLVVAVLAAGPATSAAQLPPVVGDPVRQVVDQLPPPVRDPVRGIVDQLPPLPVQPPALPVPDVPRPAPVPTAAPTAAAATPAPARTVAPARTAAPATPTATRVRPRRSAPAATPAPASRPAPRRARPTAPAVRPRLVAERSPEVRASPSPARRAAPARPPSFAAQVTNDVQEIIRAVPPAILWSLAGIVLIAVALAVNAYWESRRRTALELQREELLDDIGLLQRALLPAMPEGLGGVAVTAAYRPADGPAAGGDFYDVFMLGEERVCVLLGDVSGHGRESVTQAALARYTLRTLLAAGHPPAEALARADVLLARELQPNFVTVIAGIYDPATGELTYAKAGHAPPIVLGTAHDPDAEQPAPPLGLGVDGTWPEYRVKLGEGVSVCLFTDGLADAQVGDTRIGRAEVERMLAAHDVPDAGRLIGDLEGLADRMGDDTAAVVLSRRGS